MMKHSRPAPQIELAAAPTQTRSLQVPQISTRGEKPPPGLRFKAAVKDEAPPQSGGAAWLMFAEKLASCGRAAGAGAAAPAGGGAPAAVPAGRQPRLRTKESPGTSSTCRPAGNHLAPLWTPCGRITWHLFGTHLAPL